MNRFIFIICLIFSTAGFAKDFKYKAVMECDHCGKQIKAAMEKLRKIDTYKADPEKDIVEVSFKDKVEGLSEKDLKSIGWESGYELKPLN